MEKENLMPGKEYVIAGAKPVSRQDGMGSRV